MAISTTVEAQIALAGFNSSLWVPEHEPYANIISQRRYGFLAMLGNDDISPKANFGKTNIKRVPGLIRSSTSNSMQPKIDQYVETPTLFTANGAVTGWAAGTAQNITLDATGGLTANSVLRNKTTGAEYHVASVTSSTVVSAKPLGGGANGDGLDNIADNAEMEYLGKVYPDGATFGEGVRQTPAQNSNYMTIDVHEYGVGMIENELIKYPGQNNQVENRRKLARIQCNQGRELRMLFGSKVANTDISSTVTHYASAGLLGFSSRELDVGGSLTLAEFNSDVMPFVAQYGGGDFHAMVGGKTLGVWTNLAADNVRTRRTDRMYGNRVSRIETASEEIVLHPTEPMNRRDGEMLFFQPDLIERKYFAKFNSTHVDNIQAQNVMKMAKGYITVECIIPRNEDVISLVTGVLAGG